MNFICIRLVNHYGHPSIFLVFKDSKGCSYTHKVSALWSTGTDCQKEDHEGVEETMEEKKSSNQSC